MSRKQEIGCVMEALKATDVRIASMQHSDNPQVVAMVTKNKGYKAALEDVLHLLNGHPVPINCLARP